MTPQQADALIGMLTDTVQAQQAQIEQLQQKASEAPSAVVVETPKEDK
jgi:hypothetical protein